MTRLYFWFTARPAWQRFLMLGAALLVGDMVLMTHVAVAATVGDLNQANSPQAAITGFTNTYIAPTTASMSGAAAGVGGVTWALDQHKGKMVTGAFGVALAGMMGTGLSVGAPSMVMNAAKLFSSGSGALVHLLPHLHAVVHAAGHLR